MLHRASLVDPSRIIPVVTGCGCLLLVGALAVLLYILVFGSTDTAGSAEQAIALAALYAAIAGRRSLQVVARS